MINQDFRSDLPEQRKILQSAESYADKALTKITLLVSTGAFGLSINFLIGSKPVSTGNTHLLQTSWIFLGISILANVCGYYISRKDSVIEMDYLNERVLDDADFTRQMWNNHYKKHKSSCRYKTLEVLNSITFWSFMVGMITLILFVVLAI